ncbi:LacI family DNA-binding transcriptional regulator [Mesorhizobium sp. M0220]|uniref:LacI family DNA-binding transcriptional regulator n=1 Tax=Mesorhizobium sp. M0220 TaxID=2956920 RepID=UPI003334D3C6
MGSFGQPTINDVALRAGVSNMTVSRVVMGKGYISVKTRERVEAAINELGYRPNELAKSMRNNATRSIGFILPDLTNTSNAVVAQTAEGILAQSGYRMVLGSTGFSPEQESQFFSMFQQNTVDGVIAVIADETRAHIHDLVQNSRVPIVVLNRDLPFPVDTVYSEDRHCIRDVMQYLGRLGHRRIALITAPLTMRPGRLRHQAYAEALSELEIEFDPSLVRVRHEIAANGYQATLELLRQARRPTALIVAANQLGFGALQAVQELGLRIPRDLSFVGTDEGFVTSVIDPPLTAISRDMELVGRHAANLLLSRLAEPTQSPQSATVRSEVILRQSCDRPPDETLP